jgi:hypothetical protein
MNPIFEAALEIQHFFQKQKWRFCFIGGLTVLRWGEVRTTQDVDVSLLTEFGEEPRYTSSILGHFQARLEDAEAFALVNRTLLINATNGVEIDISLAGFPFEEEVVQRAGYATFEEGCDLFVCSAEDLIIYKVFASRDRDWVDVRGIICRQRGTLDWSHIERHLPGLCEIKGESENMARLMALRTEIDAN